MTDVGKKEEEEIDEDMEAEVTLVLLVSSTDGVSGGGGGGGGGSIDVCGFWEEFVKGEEAVAVVFVEVVMVEVSLTTVPGGSCSAAGGNSRWRTGVAASAVVVLAVTEAEAVVLAAVFLAILKQDRETSVRECVLGMCEYR